MHMQGCNTYILTHTHTHTHQVVHPPTKTKHPSKMIQRPTKASNNQGKIQRRAFPHQHPTSKAIQKPIMAHMIKNNLTQNDGYKDRRN